MALPPWRRISRPGFGGQRIARRHHAVARDHFRPALVEPALRARSAHRLDIRAGLRRVGGRDAEAGFRLALCNDRAKNGKDGSDSGWTHGPS
mgnify:CR=1 FL=1